MKMADVIAMGLTVEQYQQYFDDPIEDLPQDTVAQEAAVETPEFASEATVDVDTEAQMDAAQVAEESVTEEPAVETTTEAEPEVESVEPVVEAVAAGVALEFKNMRAAGQYLSETLSLKFTNTLDCLYKCLKAKNHKTHGYAVERLDDNRVFLTPIQK